MDFLKFQRTQQVEDIKSDSVFNEIAVGLKKYGLTDKQIEELRENEKIVTPKFLYSKLQVLLNF